jgi:cell division GTPase FtsZ
LLDAFKTADEVLHHATKGISDLISVHGLVNLDFADVRTIMRGMGDAIMGSGISEGENRAVIAADAAIHSPMLDDISITGAKGILINITGGEDLTLYDVGDATQTIYDAVGEDNEANIIFGAVTNPQMNGKIQVTVIATGFNESTIPRESKDHKKSMVASVHEKVKNSDEKKVEQLSFDLDAKKSENTAAHMRILEKDEAKETKKLKVLETLADLRAERSEVEAICESNEDATDANKSKSVDIPVVVKTGNFQKEQIFVSKGQVISHYEDDMDVPTFLRKQMQ